MPRIPRVGAGGLFYHVINRGNNRAEAWKWSSLYALKRRDRFPFLVPGPVRRPRNWLAVVNKEQTEKKVGQIRISINRERPFGDQEWVKKLPKNLD